MQVAATALPIWMLSMLGTMVVTGAIAVYLEYRAERASAPSYSAARF